MREVEFAHLVRGQERSRLHALPWLARVDAFRDQHTNALERATRGGARCSAYCVDRSDLFLGAVRPVTAGENGDEPMNVSPGRPVGAGARRVVLGSAGHQNALNRRRDNGGTTNSRLEKLGQEKSKKIKVVLI